MHEPSATIDIAIVGAGAAGLAAAIFAAEALREARAAARRIVVFESAPRIGAKILISGGGRCNVTHDRIAPEDFNGARNPVRNIIAAFDQRAAAAWFAALGVPLKREATGKLFPISDRARTVVDALVARSRTLGVELRTGARVTEVVRAQEDSPGGAAGLMVRCGDRAVSAPCVIIATGGRSLPRTGSDGAGWAMVRRLGHSVTETYPALVPLMLGAGMFHAELSGLAVNVEITVAAGGKIIDRRAGSMLWTHFGVSGPVAMDASRHWIAARARPGAGAVVMRCNFIPGVDAAQCAAWILDAAARHPRMMLRNLIAERVAERLGAAIARACGIDPAIAAGQLPRDQRIRLVEALTGFALPITGDRGWNHAEVTAGGVPLDEIDYRTMASRRVAGLYLAGELLDCDGRIGGFNFQWAWATGYLAGRAAARALRT